MSEISMKHAKKKHKPEKLRSINDILPSKVHRAVQFLRIQNLNEGG